MYLNGVFDESDLTPLELIGDLYRIFWHPGSGGLFEDELRGQDVVGCMINFAFVPMMRNNMSPWNGVDTVQFATDERCWIG